MTPIYIAFEDSLSEAVLQRLILEVHPHLQVAVSIGGRGNSYLQKKLPALRRTAQKIPVLLLTDLDAVPCAPELITSWCGQGVLPKDFLFRVAVHETEAWLLADVEGFSRFSGISRAKLPLSPELLPDPKQTLLNLVRSYGNRDIKAELMPPPGSPVRIGFGYNAALIRFVHSFWSVKRAAERADSLERTYRRLRELRAVGGNKT